MEHNLDLNSAHRSQSIIAQSFPEVEAGGYTSVDGTIEFYGRIQSLLRPDMQVLDFGAGRGAGLRDDTVVYRKDLRALQGKAAKVTVCDVDKAVLDHPATDEAVVIEPNAPLPFSDGAFDLIVCDFVFEHIVDPALVSVELSRILRPGGWICARTPNKYCLISLATRMIHNSLHSKILKWVQPERQSIDVFPTAFKLNSKSAIMAWFGQGAFDNFTYRYEPEPSYFLNSGVVFKLMLLFNVLAPSVMKSSLFVFLRKK